MYSLKKSPGNVCHAAFSCSPVSIKSTSEVSTLLLLRDVSLKLCAVDLFSNRPRPTTSSSSSFVFFSFSVRLHGLSPNDDSFLLLEVRISRRQFFGFSF